MNMDAYCPEAPWVLEDALRGKCWLEELRVQSWYLECFSADMLSSECFQAVEVQHGQWEPWKTPLLGVSCHNLILKMKVQRCFLSCLECKFCTHRLWKDFSSHCFSISLSLLDQSKFRVFKQTALRHCSVRMKGLFSIRTVWSSKFMFYCMSLHTHKRCSILQCLEGSEHCVPTQALIQAWGMCSPPRGQCQSGKYMEQVAEAPATPPPSPHSQAAHSCTFPTAAVIFPSWTITSCLWEPESAFCKLCLVPKQTAQCWLAVCCPIHPPAIAWGFDPPLSQLLPPNLGWSVSQGQTSPEQKRQCNFRVDAHPGPCFPMLAPQCPQFSSCTLTWALLFIMLSHIPGEKKNDASVHNLALLSDTSKKSV